MEIAETMLKMNIIQEEIENIHEILLTYLQSCRFDAFKNLLKRTITKDPSSIDINYVYAYPLNKSLLDIACCEGFVEFVHILLQFNANPNKLNITHNRGPIHFATELGHVDILRILLEDSRTNPNLEAGRETALHFAVRKNDIKCAKVLLDNNASPNIANSKGITPIHISASAGQREMIDILLNSSRLPPDLDNFWDFRKKTPRNIIMENFVDIQLPPQTKKYIDFNVLRFYLDTNDEQHFLDNLEYVDDQQIIDVPKLIVMATSKNFYNAVKKLMERMNDENMSSSLSEAAHIAIKYGHSEVLAEFIQSKHLKITNDMLITSCRELGTSSLRLKNEKFHRLKCLRMILEQSDIQVRCEDDKGNTPLHYAARAECTEAVTLLLKYGSYLGHRNILGIPPLAHIAPSILKEYFNECLESRNEHTDDHEINFDYTCLMPYIMASVVNPEEMCNSTLLTCNSLNDLPSNSEIDVLQYIASNRSLKNLLKHPLLSSYLYLKWHRIRRILYINSIFYILFYIFLNCYILLMTYQLELSSQGFERNINNINISESRTILTTWGQMSSLWCLVVIFLILLIIREVLQFISSPLYYITNFENWLEIMMIVLTLAILFGAGPSIGAVVILLSAWELVMLIGQHPRTSIGIEMFKTVLFNLVLFLLPYAFLILAFAMAFFTLFRNDNDSNFPDPGHSLFKTIIMLTGEFDANDIPFISHPVLSHFIFVLFIFLIAIVLFNLLIGLAVSDTVEILNKSELVGLISRTNLISYAEKIIIGTSTTNSLNCWSIPFRRRIFSFHFLIGQISLFPRYIPYAKIAVKLYKNNEICIYGRNQRMGSCTSLTMDSRIISKAKEISSAKGKISENEKIMSALNKLHAYMARLEILLDNK